MSDTAGMVRLMNHAADRLAAEAEEVGGLRLDEVSARRHWTLAAMALAEGVLRMVAACVTEESTADQVGGGE